MQGNKQTERLLNMSLFNEIKSCTYQGMGGFFAKYFKEKKWSKQSKEIYKAVKNRYVDCRWTDFPDSPDESAVWDWLSLFQDKHLIDTRGSYYKMSTSTELVGAEAWCQLDFFIKKKTDAVDISYDWKNVRVIREHWVSNNHWKIKFLQISRYVRDVFSVQPTRRFVYVFTFFGTIMELWVFDCSGPYSSGSFNIHLQPEKFIQALISYILMSDNELGLDSFIEHTGEDNSITIQEETTGKDIKIQLKQQPMVINRAIVCGETTCYHSKDGKKVVKLSWPSDVQPPEVEHLCRARDCGVTGVATVFGHHDITTIKKMRNGLTFPPLHIFPNKALSPLTLFSQSLSQRRLSQSFEAFQSLETSQPSFEKRKSIDRGPQEAKKSMSNSQTSKLREQHDAQDVDPIKKNVQAEGYRNRIFRCLLISPAGRTIKEFQSVKELLTALCNATKAH